MKSFYDAIKEVLNQSMVIYHSGFFSAMPDMVSIVILYPICDGVAQSRWYIPNVP